MRSCFFMLIGVLGCWGDVYCRQELNCKNYSSLPYIAGEAKAFCDDYEKECKMAEYIEDMSKDEKFKILLEGASSINQKRLIEHKIRCTTAILAKNPEFSDPLLKDKDLNFIPQSIVQGPYNG